MRDIRLSCLTASHDMFTSWFRSNTVLQNVWVYIPLVNMLPCNQCKIYLKLCQPVLKWKHYDKTCPIYLKLYNLVKASKLLKAELHSKPKLSMFMHFLKIIDIFFPFFNENSILKQLSETLNLNLPDPMNFIPFGTMTYSLFDINLMSITYM